MYYLCLVKRSRPDEPNTERLSKLENVLYAAAVTGNIDGILISSNPVNSLSCYKIENLKIVGRGFNQALYVLFDKDKVKVYIIRYRRNSFLDKIVGRIYERERPKEDITYVVFRVFKDSITHKDRNTSSKVRPPLYPSL